MNKNESKYFNTAILFDEALIYLLENKDIEYITIKEICNKASSVKSPAPLAEFGNFNRKDFYKEMLSWFN